MYKNILKGKFSQREIKIMQKAKTYGVEVLSNELLAKELFGLRFAHELNKEKLEELLKFYNACDKSVEMAQLSSFN